MALSGDGEIVMPEVSIDLGGKDRRMVYDHRAAMRLERVTQTHTFGENIDFGYLSNVVYFCWATLCRHCPELDGFISADGIPDAKASKGIDTVTDWIQEADLSYVLKKITEVFTQSRPKPSEVEEKN